MQGHGDPGVICNQLLELGLVQGLDIIKLVPIRPSCVRDLARGPILLEVDVQRDLDSQEVDGSAGSAYASEALNKDDLVSPRALRACSEVSEGLPAKVCKAHTAARTAPRL